jgi:hypothetical protein
MLARRVLSSSFLASYWSAGLGHKENEKYTAPNKALGTPKYFPGLFFPNCLFKGVWSPLKV